MALILRQSDAVELVEFVDAELESSPCDHTLRLTERWAAGRKVDWDDLLDVLEENGCFCDCEVVLNLPDDRDIELPPGRRREDQRNAWLLPPGFEVTEQGKDFDRIVCSDPSVARNCHAPEGEMLVPAPSGATPSKRVRRSVHFFIGIPSGLPSEVGIVRRIEPTKPAVFAKRVRDAGIEELRAFGTREACFFLARLAKLPDGATVGTSLSNVTGISTSWQELRVHRVIIRRRG